MWLSGHRSLPSEATGEENSLRRKTVCRDIREPATLEVGIGREIGLGLRGEVVGQVPLDGLLLVPGAVEVVAEAARAGGPRHLGCVGVGAAHGGDVRTGARELGREFGRLFAVVGLAGGADSGVA